MFLCVFSFREVTENKSTHASEIKCEDNTSLKAE